MQVRGSDSLEKRLLAMAAARIQPEEEIAPGDQDRRDRARRNLFDFTTYTMPDFEANWHHQRIAEKLDAWIRGDITRLILCAPPQHFKTELASRRLPALVLGRDPDAKVMGCSYGDFNAGLINRDVQKIIDSDSYRELFPATQLWGQSVSHKARGKWMRNNDIFEIVGRRGSYRSAGIGSGITGQPFTHGIIDDPIKSDKEANSPTYRQFVWDWYTSEFSLRKTKAGARILLILTRWHKDDLAGRLLDLMTKNSKADRWELLALPGILENEGQRTPGDPRKVGEALHEARHPLVELEAERAQMRPQKWQALYQQSPTNPKGVIFKDEDFRYFWVEGKGPDQVLVLDDNPPEGGEREQRRYAAKDCRWFQTCDPADADSGDGAYTCVVTFAVTPGGDLLVYHVWRARLDFPKRYRAIADLREGVGEWDPALQRWRPLTSAQYLRAKFHGSAGNYQRWPKPLVYQAVENKASGMAIIQTGAAEGLPFRKLNPGTKNKTERCGAVSVLYNNHKVFHRHGEPWLGEFEQEIKDFPTGRQADQADCLAYGGILKTQDVILYANVDGELLAYPDAPRDEDGRIIVAGPGADAADDQVQEFEVGGTRVTFTDESKDWWR